MELIINSRILKRKVIFSRPGKNYVYVNLNNREGTLGNQICEGGSLMGSTIESTDESFESDCLNWYRAYIRR